MATRILVVDDNRDMLRDYLLLVQDLSVQRWPAHASEAEVPVEVEGADTFSHALKKLESQPFDLLIVDLRMPGPDGREYGGLDLIEESRKIDALRPVIVVTGYGSVELARKTLTQGVFDFIEKGSEHFEIEFLDAVKRAIAVQEEKNRRSGNPFTLMTGGEPMIFGGRTSELRFFEEKLNRTLHTKFREHFLILGDWGIGKSTLLREYKKICQSRGYLAAVVHLEALAPGATPIEAARSIVEGVLRNLPYTVDRFKKLSEYFDAIGISVLGTGLQISRDTSKADLSAQAFLHDTLLNLWDDLKDKGDVLVLLLDDLGNFLPVSEIFMTLRQTLVMDRMQEAKILVGLTSTSDDWRALTSLKRNHPLARYFMVLATLAPLQEDEVRDTINKSLAGTGVSFSEDVLAKVFEYTEGHPFEMQVLCHHLFRNQLSRRVEMDVWDKALQEALHQMGLAIFDLWFDQASAEEAKVLRLLAQEEEPVTLKQLRTQIQQGEQEIKPGNISRYVKRLAEKKLISKSGRGLYTIPDKMFRAYILAQTV